MSEPKTSPAPVPVRLLKDFWADSGSGEGVKRIKAGTELDLPLNAAKTLIAAGKAVRNDPLPGDRK